MNNLSLLIVDDSEMDRFYIEKIVKKTREIQNIFYVTNGEEALNCFINENYGREICKEYYPPNLVFLDINMPLLNGLEFLEKFNAIPHKNLILKNMIISILSSSDTPGEKEKAFSYPFVKNYFKKPLQKANVQEFIDTYFKQISV